MSAITVILTCAWLVGLHISAQNLHAAESMSNQGELFVKQSYPQISQEFEGFIKSNNGQGGYSGSSYGVGGTGGSSYDGSYAGSVEHGMPGYGQFGYGSRDGSSYGSDGYRKVKTYGSYGVGNYGKLGLRNGGNKQSAHALLRGASYVGDSHLKSDSSEPSIKSIAKVYFNHFLNKFVRGKDTSRSAAEKVGSAYEAPVITHTPHSYPSYSSYGAHSYEAPSYECC